MKLNKRIILSRVLLEKLIVTQFAKKVPAFYEDSLPCSQGPPLVSYN